MEKHTKTVKSIKCDNCFASYSIHNKIESDTYHTYYVVEHGHQ